MKQIQLANNYKDIFPVQIRYYNYRSTIAHWHPRIELYFVLSGQATVHVEDEEYLLQEEDVLLINSNDTHSIISNNAETMCLELNLEGIPYFKADLSARFNLNSSGNTRAPRYDFIKYLMSQFIRVNESAEHPYKTLSLFYSLYGHLMENFLAPPLQDLSSSRKNKDRINSITDYIYDHYKEVLTLSDVADAHGLSAPYFSSFFEKNTGKTFLTFYNEIRLKYATRELLNSDESIEKIALSNGFNDSRSFVSLFKKKYGDLPSNYRKQHIRCSSLLDNTENNDNEQKSGAAAVEYIIGFDSLMKYEHIYSDSKAAPVMLDSSIKIIDAGKISVTGDYLPLSHNYHKLICVGSANQFLYQEVQEMIKRTQSEIGFEYVKFHGILSDDMMVYNEDTQGNPQYSFTMIDKVFDFILSVGLRPLCQLSFMPIALSSCKERLVDFYHYNTAPPKDIKKWEDLIYAFMEHIINRYGMKEIKKWLFCVWNEPDETVKEFSWENREMFFDFYCRTYRVVKSFDSKLQFGTPSLLLSITEEDGWAAEFFKYITQEKCVPDFLNIHYYDNTLFEADKRDRTREDSFSAQNMSNFFPLSDDPYAFMKFINNLKLLMKHYHMKSIPVYLTEWNLTISHRDLLNDTCFKACYLAKNLLENYDRLSSFGYWVLTDFIEEMPLPNDLYHGGLGLFTYNGIPKAHYNAFKLFGYLKGQMIARGDGYFITREDNKIVFILYNYEHFSKLFASGTKSISDNANRYESFSFMDNAKFMVTFTDIDNIYTKALIKERLINQNYGSSFDAWVKMGAQPLTKEEDMELLRQQSQPGLYIHRDSIHNNELSINLNMAPLEVRSVEVELLR